MPGKKAAKKTKQVIMKKGAKAGVKINEMGLTRSSMNSLKTYKTRLKTEGKGAKAGAKLATLGSRVGKKSSKRKVK